MWNTHYYVRIMLYMRARVLLKILSRLGNWSTDPEKLNRNAIVGVRGNQRPEVWDIHYQNFLKRGWSYLNACNFVHHCTDGPKCQVAFAFSKKEARQLFAIYDVTSAIFVSPWRDFSRKPSTGISSSSRRSDVQNNGLPSGFCNRGASR